MFKRAPAFRLVTGFIVIAALVMAGLASAHARTHVPRLAVAKAAPCHEHAENLNTPCKQICASGLPDHLLTDAGPVVCAPLLLAPVVYEAAYDTSSPPVLLAAAWWLPPPGEGLPTFLRHQRLLI